MKTQLVITFGGRVEMLAWLIDIVEAGALDAPGRRREAIRARPADSLDVAGAEQFVVTTEAGVRHLALREEHTIEAVIEGGAR